MDFQNYALVSATAVTGTVLYALEFKENFYNAMVFLWTSKLSLLVRY